MKPLNLYQVLIMQLLAMFSGFVNLETAYAAETIHQASPTTTQETSSNAYYTCSMHPQIRSEDPNGRCPICGMSLVPVQAELRHIPTNTNRQISMSAAAMKLADIDTTPVTRGYPLKEVRLFGNIGFDETQIADISAYFPGRIERLFVNYEGIPVKAGDHLAEVYSPDLITAQQELKEALKAASQTQTNSLYSQQSAQANLNAARDKLRLWGLTATQIRKIENSHSVQETLTIYSPQNGIVIQQDVQEGKYLNTGDRIYRVASLDRLWINLEAYESQLPWLRLGQPVVFETDAQPGKSFHGKISFISPTVNPKKRTVAVRVNIENATGTLKPGLFVRASVKSKIAGYGRVLDSGLKGKWIGPMHPEVVMDGPGTCPICGMDLVPVSELGYFDDSSLRPPLLIPASAPLITGKRAIVFVKVNNSKIPTFESKEIKLGPRAGDFFIVEDGLKEQERVVTKGAFKIDSAMQIGAKPSMMNDQYEPNSQAHQHHHH
ncbi:MAG: efflux RND transporter periplasmic adaptor subunit [Pseudomonadales bacterium]|nr:efflux RND transporter periplasmic adaptor subunit [Pseudomonadales bacterium]